MRLVDLNPQFVFAGGDGVTNADHTPAARREGVGVMFDCPCPSCTSRRAEDVDHNSNLRHYIPFENPLDGGAALESGHPKWRRVGDTFDSLQLQPSILSDTAKGGCGWHGYIGHTIPGEVTTC